MPEGYYLENSNSIDDALDELLCEYVDGVMDPDVRVVFEEYLASEPNLAAHVSQLCDTRDLLCSFGACKCASSSLQAQLRVRLAGELSRKNRSSMVISEGLGNMALLTSALGMVLIVSMMVGLVSVVQQTASRKSQIPEITEAEQELRGRSMQMVDDAHGLVQRTVRLDNLAEAQQLSFLGPVTALPVVAGTGSMTPIRLYSAVADLP